jgi:hypothetical protein
MDISIFLSKITRQIIYWCVYQSPVPKQETLILAYFCILVVLVPKRQNQSFFWYLVPLLLITEYQRWYRYQYPQYRSFLEPDTGFNAPPSGEPTQTTQTPSWVEPYWSEQGKYTRAAPGTFCCRRATPCIFYHARSSITSALINIQNMVRTPIWSYCRVEM